MIKTDGVFFTGGSEDLDDNDGYPTPYKRVLVSIINYATKKND